MKLKQIHLANYKYTRTKGEISRELSSSLDSKIFLKISAQLYSQLRAPTDRKLLLYSLNNTL